MPPVHMEDIERRLDCIERKLDFIIKLLQSRH